MTSSHIYRELTKLANVVKGKYKQTCSGRVPARFSLVCCFRIASSRERKEQKTFPEHIFEMPGRRSKTQKLDRSLSTGLSPSITWIMFWHSMITRIVCFSPYAANRMRSPLKSFGWSSSSAKPEKNETETWHCEERRSKIRSYIERREHFLDSVLRRTSASQEQKTKSSFR